MGVTNRFLGSGVVEGVKISMDGQVVSTAAPGPSFSFDVGCDGTISNGVGHDQLSGELVSITDAPGARAMITNRFSGSESYTFTGSVSTNLSLSGLPELHIKVKVTSGSMVVAVSGLTQTPFGDFPIESVPPSRQDFSGSMMDLILPIQNYSAQDGILEVDMKQSPTFQFFQAMADALVQGAGIPVNITYSGAAVFESTAIQIESVQPLYKEYFLKGIPAMNPVKVSMLWRNSTGTRRVRFSYDGVDLDDDSGSDSIERDFDMGKDDDHLTILASADGVADGPKTLELKKVAVSPWAKPFLKDVFRHKGSIGYRGNAEWPPLPAIHSTFGSIPIVGGVWSLLSEGKNDCFIEAYSQGAPIDPGKLDWQYRFSVPFTVVDLKLALNGTTSTTINERGLKMNGEARLEPLVLSASKGITIGELFPGFTGAACSLSSHLCGALATAGLEASLQFSMGGNGRFSADEMDQKIEWDTGTAQLRLSAQLLLTVSPPPLHKVIQGRVWGRATACMDLKFYPEIAVERFGADLSAGYAVDILGFRVLADFKRWPLVGKGCEVAASGPPAALSSFANSAPAGDFPTAGQAQVALGPDGWVAAVWIESPDGPAGSHGDVFLRLTHPSALRRTVRLTVDAGADQAPHVAFDKQGRALVVWQRNAVFTGNPSLEQLDAFAAGFEIARALIDPATGQVLDSGLLTTNAVFDFGATLQANAGGDVLLTWGQSKRVFGGGDAQDPASIYGAIWDGTAWSASESIATHLQGNFGWRAAFGSNQTAAVAYVLDGDLDFATTADRELYLVQRSNGAWGTPSRITSNSLDDRFPALRFMPDNRLAVAWVQGSQVVGLLVGNTSTPSVWIQTNDWVGLSFAHAELVASGSKLFAVWPAANDLYIAQLPIDPAAPVTPSQPTVLHADPLAVETAFAATLDEFQQLRYVAVSHPVSQTEDGLPILAERSGFTSGTKDLRPSVSASPLIRDIQALTPSKYRLTWASPAGKRYTIQSSTDLRAWVDESVGSATQAETAADLEVSPGLKAKFFRIKLD